MVSLDVSTVDQRTHRDRQRAQRRKKNHREIKKLLPLFVGHNRFISAVYGKRVHELVKKNIGRKEGSKETERARLHRGEKEGKFVLPLSNNNRVGGRIEHESVTRKDASSGKTS